MNRNLFPDPELLFGSCSESGSEMETVREKKLYV
jgi:hypothetical protein